MNDDWLLLSDGKWVPQREVTELRPKGVSLQVYGREGLIGWLSDGVAERLNTQIIPAQRGWLVVFYDPASEWTLTDEVIAWRFYSDSSWPEPITADGAPDNDHWLVQTPSGVTVWPGYQTWPTLAEALAARRTLRKD